MIIEAPWYTALICPLIGFTYAALLYLIGRNRFGKGLRAALFTLRFLVVTAIAFLLLAPVAKQTVHERMQPNVVLLQDVSGSVVGGTDSAFSLAALDGKLGDRLRLKHEFFGSAGYTDLGAALLQHRHDDVAAIVVATDGIHNRGTNPATATAQLACPVYTVALGDTTPTLDAAIADLHAPRYAMQGNMFPVEVTVNASLLGGHNATLYVNDANGQNVASLSIEYAGDDFSTTQTLAIEASQPGLQRFSAALVPVAGEASTANNKVDFYVDVIDTRHNVAIIANAPHPDLGALKHAIESNPNYEATIVPAADAEAGKWQPGEECSMVVLHNLPSRNHTDISYAGNQPRLFIIGLQTDLPRFNALHSGLEIVSKTNKTNEVAAQFQEGFGLFSLDRADADAIEQLPPLAAPFGEARLAASVQNLFTARIGNIDSRQPLVAATAQGELRQAFVWGEGLWRWRIADYAANGTHGHTDRLISQLIGFTSLRHQRDRLQVEAARSFAEGEHPTLKAMLFNESYEPTNASDVTLHLSGDSIAEADYSFMKDGSGYRLTLPLLPNGLYRYTATADGQSTTGMFAVEPLNLEQRRLTADHALLRHISHTTGGATFSPDQLDELCAQLSSLKPTIHTRSRYSDLTRLPLVLALIVLLLAAEWFLRKYNGRI